MLVAIEHENDIGGVVDDAFELTEMTGTVAEDVGVQRQRGVEDENFFQGTYTGLGAFWFGGRLLMDQGDQGTKQVTVGHQIPMG